MKAVNFVIRLKNFDEDRRIALSHRILRHRRDKGSLWLDQILLQVAEDENPIVYSTNGPGDAWTVAKDLQSNGAEIDVCHVDDQGNMVPLAMDM